MKLRKDLTRQQQDVYDLLAAAADAGAPAPSNSEIADQCAVMHHSDASEFVKTIERKGLIAVQRKGNSRTITIVATGKTCVTAPSWSPQGIVADPGYRGPVPEHLRVDRDACPRCAVRRDIGCVHSATRIGLEMGL